MLELSHSIKIDVAPEEVTDWFGELPENYRSWHPEHVTAKWLVKTEEGVGTVFYAEQKLDGDRGGYTFTVTEYIPGRLIVYKPAFPRSLNLSRGSFMIEPVEGGCIFTATLRFRFGFLMSENFLRDIEIHIGEEGETELAGLGAACRPGCLRRQAEDGRSAGESGEADEPSSAVGTHNRPRW